MLLITRSFNLSYSRYGEYNPSSIANIFGESISTIAKSKSAISKRNNTSKKFGFKNLGEFSLWVYNKKLNKVFGADISKELNCERHFPYKFISIYNMDKCLKEYDENNENLKLEIRKFISQGASVHKISEILLLEIPTICLYIGDFDQNYNRQYLSAVRKGLTKEELEIKVSKLILDGKSFTETSEILSLDLVSVKRYFLNCIRARLKSSDL